MDELKNYVPEEISYNKILVAVDSDDFISSVKAFNYAITTAKHYNVPLGIVSVLETGDLNIFQSLDKEVLNERREEIKDIVNLYADKAEQAGVIDATGIFGEGNPGHVIVEQVLPNFKPDLLIVGSETKKNVRKTIGTHAQFMVNYANCSVFVVR